MWCDSSDKQSFAILIDSEDAMSTPSTTRFTAMSSSEKWAIDE